MSTQAAGPWKNAPLGYAVAEVAISPHYTLQQHIPAVQQALRPLFPRTAEGFGLRIGLSDPNAMPQPQQEQFWQLTAADNSRGVQIGTRAFALHATEYQTYEAFAVDLEAMLKAVSGAQIGAFVERIGIRYVDYILPSEGHRPEEYVVEALRGLALPQAGQTQSATWAGTYAVDNSFINLRVLAPAPPGMLLPPNFAALPLSKPATMSRAEHDYVNRKPFGLIDTDCFRPISATLDVETLMAAFRQLHELVSSSFRAVMSDLAREEWL